MLKDGHQSINRDLYNHHKYSHYGMDDHKPYTVFWPWHIWGSHLKDIDGLKPATSETWHGNLYDSAHHWRLERNSLLWNWGFSVGIIHDMIYIYGIIIWCSWCIAVYIYHITSFYIISGIRIYICFQAEILALGQNLKRIVSSFVTKKHHLMFWLPDASWYVYI